MQEVDTKDGNGTVWQPRPADPELEAEFLRKMMVRLGASQSQADAMVAASPTVKQIATVSTVDGQPVVTIAEEFDRAWRRVGLALDRTGFTVEDRDRKQGVYFVRYVAPNPQMKDQGFFGRFFSSAPKPNEAAKFQIAVKSQGESTVVSVLNATGAPDNSASAQKIVKVIADDIK
jgi:outer membrane protein assembly factor BamC